MLLFDFYERQAEINRLYHTSANVLSKELINKAYRDLNMIDLVGSEKIYRIYPLERFINLLWKGKDAVVQTKLWEDPYENFLLGAKNAYHNGLKIDLSEVHDSWYGQCWTLTEESDGLWRTYTNNRQIRAVKVSTTVEKLFSNFYDDNDEFKILHYFIGKVRYEPQDAILSFLKENQSDIMLNSDNILQAITLLIKRLEFLYEDEVRLIYSTEANGQALPKIHEYTIDPNNVFDQVVMDPWTDENEAKAIAYRIRFFGYKGDIQRSDLYAPNNAHIIF